MPRRSTMGTYGPTYYGGFSPVLNWWKTGNSPTITRSAGGSLSGKAIWDAGGYLDAATGEIVNPAPADLLTYSRVFFAQVSAQQVTQGCNYNGESWIAEWDGSATVVAANIGTGGSQSMSGSNKLLFTFGTSPQNAQLTFTLTNRNDPPRNVRVYQARYESNVLAGEKFNPDWVSQANKFGIVRFGPGWIFTNNETLREFSEFADQDYVSWFYPLNDGSNPVAASSHGPKGSTHPSFMCDAAAALGPDVRIHVTIPYLASESCVAAMAQYYKDHCSNKVIYEYCNEHWNSGFWFFFWLASAGSRVYGKAVTAIATGNPTTLTVPAHGLSNGNTINFYTTATGYTSMDATYKLDGTGAYAVTVVNADTITIPFDTTGFPAFTAGDTFVSADANRIYRYYGYRSAAVMKIIRDVYNDTSRWEGILGAFNAGPSIGTQILNGVNDWRANVLTPANSLAVTDLFTALEVTGYFSTDVPAPKTITNITQANPGVVTAASHGFANGTKVKLFISAGMTQLNDTYATVANATTNTFELQGVNTTAMTAYASGTNFAVNSRLFDIMDESNTRFLADPVTYPTKYSYYNRQLADEMLSGSSQSALPYLKNTLWPAHYAIAKANGLELRQYEGGCHFLGSGALVTQGDASQFNDYMINFANSEEAAEVYAESYKAWRQVGGKYPCKFVEGGTNSRFGIWAGFRFLKLAGNGETDDLSNPVWQAVLDWNDNDHPETWTARYGA